jgi:16S rRNA (adenine1518-N6/adenine1519-N6)-dimethyltransferase
MTGRSDRRRTPTHSGRPAARRELGQHFLVDENLLGVIGRLARLGPEDVVLEVGSGLGVLTAYLADRVARVHAVELDRSLEPTLREAFAGRGNVELHIGDALQLELAALDPPPDKLVSNLPYNIATPLVVESLDGLPSVELWCVMVQREVAERFFAQPSTKAYGAVSVLVQLAAERTGFHPVSREVFRPRPNVDSALVAFRRRELPPGYPRVKNVTTAAFAHRRKRLANSLELAGVADRAAATAALEAIGRDPGARAEELAPQEFVALANALVTVSR